MKLIVLLFSIIFLFSCVSYNPRIMESQTYGERMADVIILMAFGASIGIAVYGEVR